MRLIELLVGDERRDATLSILDDNDIDYAVIEEAGERQESTLVHFPIPTEAVDDLLDTLREDANIDEQAYTVITEAETATTEHIDELEERYAETDENSDDTLPSAELVTKARALNPNSRTYYAMTFFSTIIAAAGLLRSSPEAIVGAMVIAPFFGTALSVAAGVCCGEEDMFFDGVRSQFLGVSVAVLGSAMFAVVAREMGFVPHGMVLTRSSQYTLFMTPSFLSAGVAIAAGAAGGFALATSLPVALAGVAIAAAITPSAAALGIALAWGKPVQAAGAFVLLAVNVAAVNLMAIAVMTYLGYRPSLPVTLSSSLSPRQIARAIVVAVIVLFVAGTGAAAYQQVEFNRTVNDEVHHTISEEYPMLEVGDVTTEYNAGVLLPRSKSVTVTVIRTSERNYPKLARKLDARISKRVDDDVEVKVHFVTFEGTGKRDESKGRQKSFGNDAVRFDPASNEQALVGRSAIDTHGFDV
ncbi:TIGR00341 family protein [Haladaptatus caseinilyticus]|uniref:TIGR00341 family protein n=1 Tax=Haladaptatus caseinilyticus TaxID=2993314 RepID=UPI00224ABC23|nr:TIGR00341 family protein [Haladaptatus caseinilyticus]